VLHKTLGATTVDTDQEMGTFQAIVSAWGPDREKDVIMPTAFDATIAAWRSSGKNLPLLFEHSTEAVGHVDPSTMQATEDGLLVGGEVDRSTEKGQQVWRQIKAGSIGFSIGFMAKSTPRKGGGRRLTEIDLLEVSATSTPMHPAARAVSWKSAHDDEEERAPTHRELERELIRQGLITSAADADQYRRADPVFVGLERNGDEESKSADPVAAPTDYELQVRAEELRRPARGPHAGTRRCARSYAGRAGPHARTRPAQVHRGDQADPGRHL
jgi:HK97 family phage prohead protease